MQNIGLHRFPILVKVTQLTLMCPCLRYQPE